MQDTRVGLRAQVGRSLWLKAVVFCTALFACCCALALFTACANDGGAGNAGAVSAAESASAGASSAASGAVVSSVPAVNDVPASSAADAQPASASASADAQPASASAAVVQESGAEHSAASRDVSSAAKDVQDEAEPVEEAAAPVDNAEQNLGPKTVVVIGDSIASGHVFGYDDPNPWPFYLQERLYELEGEWYVQNLGVSSTMLMSTANFPYRTTGNIELAKEISPDYVLLMLGTNDSFDPSWDEAVYHAELRALVDELYAACPQVKVVLMSPPHVFCDPDPAGEGVFHMDDGIIGNEIRTAMIEVADATGSQFVDVYAFTEGRSDWFPDTVHPDGMGNRAIADFVFESVFA